MFERRNFAAFFSLLLAGTLKAGAPGGKRNITGAVPDTFILKPNGWVPNNPQLPVLLYRNAVPLTGDDPASVFEAIFQGQAGRLNGATVYMISTIITRRRTRCSASLAATHD